MSAQTQTDDMDTEHIEQVVTNVADKATIGGGLTGLTGWMIDSNTIGLIGVCVAVVGLLVNWYYKHKHYKLAERQAGIK